MFLEASKSKFDCRLMDSDTFIYKILRRKESKMSGSNQVVGTCVLMWNKPKPNNLIMADSKLKLKWNCIGSSPMSQKRQEQRCENTWEVDTLSCIVPKMPILHLKVSVTFFKVILNNQGSWFGLCLRKTSSLVRFLDKSNLKCDTEKLCTQKKDGKKLPQMIMSLWGIKPFFFLSAFLYC